MPFRNIVDPCVYLNIHNATERIIIAAVGVGNALTVPRWAATGDWSATGVAAAITGVGFAIIGLVTYGIRQIGAARVESFKAWDAANKDSLTGTVERLTAEVATLNESVARSRASLHEFRNEAATRQAQHSEEVDRLMRQIALLQTTVDHQAEEIERLNTRVRELTAATVQVRNVAQSVQAVTESVRASLTGELPPVPDPGSGETRPA